MDRFFSLDNIALDDDLLVRTRVIGIDDLIESEIFIESDFFFTHCSSV